MALVKHRKLLLHIIVYIGAVASEIASAEQRIELPHKGLTLTIPTGWEVDNEHTQYGLVVTGPRAPGIRYQPNIQVLKLLKPWFIDGDGAEEFKSKILTLAKSSAAFQNFEIRDWSIVTLRNLSQGILYYSTMSLGSVKIMQAHLLVASATHHFLATYTDVVEHFEGTQRDPIFDAAWQALISIEVDSPAPSRYGIVGWIVGALAGGALMVGIFLVRRSRRRNSEFDVGGGGDEGSILSSEGGDEGQQGWDFEEGSDEIPLADSADDEVNTEDDENRNIA